MGNGPIKGKANDGIRKEVGRACRTEKEKENKGCHGNGMARA